MKKSSLVLPDVETLLAASRGILPLAPSVQARALARAAATMREPVAARPTGRVPWVFAAAAGLVVSLGAAAYAARAWLDESAAPPTAHVAPVTSLGAKASRPLPVVAVAPERDAPTPIEPSPKRTRGKSVVPPVRPTNAELQLLRSAGQDVTRGDFAGALAVLAKHARRFPNGSLVEEREALRVKSLAGIGRADDAQRAAARFHERFPHSVLLSTFERMTERDR